MKPKLFSSPDQFRKWLEQNHDSASELLAGFHKKSSGKPSITYAEALDEALCFGWIDGVRRNLNEEETQVRRLKQLIENSEKGVRSGVLVPKPKE